MCNEEEVEELLSSVDVSKASGPDDISAKNAKEHSTLHHFKYHQIVQSVPYSREDSFSLEGVHSGTYTKIGQPQHPHKLSTYFIAEYSQ